MEVTQLSSKTFDQAHERLKETFVQMIVAGANAIPAPSAKSVTWLMGYTAKELDPQVSVLNYSEPLGLSQRRTKKFALDLPDETEDRYHIPEEAAKVVVTEK